MAYSVVLPSLSHFRNGNGWIGSAGLLRYELEAPQEEQVRVVLWYGPFSRPFAVVVEEKTFPLSPEGLTALTQWLLTHADEMNAHPAKTPADTQADYQAAQGQ